LRAQSVKLDDPPRTRENDHREDAFMPATETRRAVRAGLFGVGLGGFCIALSVFGFLTDQASKLFSTRQFVWVSRAADSFVYWTSNTTFAIFGFLIIAGSIMVILKARRDAALASASRSCSTRA
jgi:hypothetical protein